MKRDVIREKMTRVKELIDTENKLLPYTDEELALMARMESHNRVRYIRQLLDIPNSNHRRTNNG